MASRVAMRFPCPSAPVFNIPVLFLCWAAVLETEGQAFLGKARVGAVCGQVRTPVPCKGSALYSCPSDSYGVLLFYFM